MIEHRHILRSAHVGAGSNAGPHFFCARIPGLGEQVNVCFGWKADINAISRIASNGPVGLEGSKILGSLTLNGKPVS